MATPEERPDQLYGVWFAPPPWTSWKGEATMYRTQEEAEYHARGLARYGQKAVVYRAYPIAEFQHEEPTRTGLYA